MKASDNPFSSLLLVEGGTPATPAAGDQRLFVDVADHVVKKVNSSGIVTTVGGAALTTTSALLGAPVTMTNANTFYDGPSVSLAAGTWLLYAGISAVNNGAASAFTAKLWDGTTVLVSDQQTSGAAFFVSAISLSSPVSPGTTTTYKISVASSAAGSSLLAATPNNPAGNNASWIWAVKIA